MDNHIKVVNAALEDRGEDIILRGVIAPESLTKLRVDTYQREFLGGDVSSGRITSLKKAVEKGEVLPDVELGMRGQGYTSRGTTFMLNHDVYIIDGFQRIQTVINWMKDHPGDEPRVRIGAMIHFDTNREWERDQFKILNTKRTSVSPNVILRNEREIYPSVLTLYGISNNNKLSPLYRRVSWDQRMKRGELFTALMIVRVALVLHSNTGSSSVGVGGGGGRGAAQSLENSATRVGLSQFRQNVETFFDTIDEAFGIKGIVYRQLAPQTKTNFLTAVAQMFVMHRNFWKGKELHIKADDKARLRTFPLTEPTVVKLSASGNSALPLLGRLLIDHMNRGRTTNRLEPRMVPAKAEPMQQMQA